MNLSVIIPLYNEAECVPELIKRVKAVLSPFAPFEIICVDDGSTDKTFERLLEEKKICPEIKIIKFKYNCGKTDALDAGIKETRGEKIVILDGDLQNPPEAIPLLLEGLKEADAVVGWRFDRKDPPIKKWGSQLANAIRRMLLRDTFHDNGCGFKAFYHYTVKHLTLYKNLETFLPNLIKMQGYKVIEIKVPHDNRNRGKSKYRLISFSGLSALINLLFVLRIKRNRLNYQVENIIQ